MQPQLVQLRLQIQFNSWYNSVQSRDDYQSSYHHGFDHLLW